MDAAEKTRRVVQRARALGFELCGICSVEAYRAGVARLPEWLARGYGGEMRYLEDPRRLDPERVVPGARSIVVCAMNYNTALPYSTEAPPADDVPQGWVSRYAWGDDYHEVLSARLEKLAAAMRSDFAEPFEARWYVDTGPVVERVAAAEAGLGWLAKNTCLINEERGSWLFLGAVVTTLELAPTAPAGPPPDLCGQCTLCIEACPTEAIVAPYLLDARRCISYLTIELRGAIPEELRAPMGRMVFGCDICQDVCPWNRKAPVTPLVEFQPRSFTPPVAAGFSPPNAGEGETRNSKLETRETLATHHSSLFTVSLEWLAGLTEEQFREMFGGSALRRAKWRGLVRNACVALGNWLARQAQRDRAGRTLAATGEEAQAYPVPEKPATSPAGPRPGQDPVSRALGLLERLAASADPLIAEHARWALARAPRGAVNNGKPL